MAHPLKQLAGETAIYGLSSILARVLNFLFVPIYTRMLTRSQYGTVTEFLAFVAILQVVLVLGLETGCFRFANKEGENPRKVYSNALMAVLGLNAIRGDSHHVTAIHHLYDSPKGGNLTAYNNKQAEYRGNSSVTLYPLRDRYGEATSTSGNPKDAYSSGWFIPSKEEWQLIGSTLSLDHINEYLGMIKCSDKIVKTEYYWTPRQDPDSYKVGIVVRGDGSGYKGLNKKDGRARLRAMMAF